MPIAEYNNPNLDSQAKRRRGARLVDQHGRPWFANLELKTGDPCGPIEPLFQAPLIPPQVYLRKSRDENQPNNLVILYDAWINEIINVREERIAKAREIARKMFATAYDPEKPLGPDIMSLVGDEPEPIEPIIAAMQGNSYVLGKSPVDQHGLERFFVAQRDKLKRRDLSTYGDFRDKPSHALDPDALEEQFDGDATGGTRVPVRRKHRKTEPEAA